MPQDPLNPYSAPLTVVETARTPKGFTPARCAAGFTAAGAIGGVLAGITAVYGSQNSWSAAWVLAVPGILLGVGLGLSVTRYIGGIEWSDALGLVIGCLSGLACMGLVLDSLWTGFRGGRWTFASLLPLAIAPMTGMVLVAATVRIVGGFVRTRMQITVWICGSILGFAGFWSVQALGTRTGWRDLMLVTSMACFQAGLSGLIGWQLGTARSVVDGSSDASDNTAD